ncbi:MAG: hypothetical protein ABUL62_23145 [Myxococcales bacterium]
MPDPIQSIAPSSYLPIEGASAEETAGQVCLPPALPNASASPAAADAPPTSPAVPALVARFSAPTGSHPPVQPSLGKALEHCGWEVANAAVSVATALVTGPAGLATTLLSGARGVIGLGSAERCIERDRAQQVAEGQRANQAADCARDGAVPLLNADGAVICARP